MLPGPPREMKDMFERQLAPWLRKRSGEHIESRFLRIFGVGESKTEMLLLDLFHGDNPTLALYCGAGEVTARISARVPLGEDASALIDPMEAEIRRRLGNAVYAAYGPGEEVSLASTVLKMLAKRGETVTTAESCTGGMLISHLIDCPGASAAVHEGHVTYSNEAKMRVLGVRAETLEQYGAVSAECALEMAEGARRVSGSDLGHCHHGRCRPRRRHAGKAGRSGLRGHCRPRRRTRRAPDAARRPRLDPHADLPKRPQPPPLPAVPAASAFGSVLTQPRPVTNGGGVAAFRFAWGDGSG